MRVHRKEIHEAHTQKWHLFPCPSTTNCLVSIKNRFCLDKQEHSRRQLIVKFWQIFKLFLFSLINYLVTCWVIITRGWCLGVMKRSWATIAIMCVDILHFGCKYFDAPFCTASCVLVYSLHVCSKSLELTSSTCKNSDSRFLIYFPRNKERCNYVIISVDSFKISVLFKVD